MTDITERLHTIRAHLQTGAVGQREVWEEWLDEAAAEIERHMREKVALAGLVSKERDAVERLRAALQRIADDGKNCQDYCRNQARRALEPKP